jgi:hypothetical protein
MRIFHATGLRNGQGKRAGPEIVIAAAKKTDYKYS